MDGATSILMLGLLASGIFALAGIVFRLLAMIAILRRNAKTAMLLSLMGSLGAGALVTQSDLASWLLGKPAAETTNDKDKK